MAQIDKSPYVLKDYQHASRIFRSGVYDLSPRKKYLFHTVFEINKSIKLDNPALRDTYKYDIGLVVKSITLPSFDITVNTMNQYNRTTLTQSKQKYQPIEIIFHNDNMGIVHELWRSYYSHYYSDLTTAKNPKGYDRDAMTKQSNKLFGHAGNIDRFFNSITVYQLTRKEFVSYKLINPIISKFSHNEVDYYSKDRHDLTMSVAYEAVDYNTGIVPDGDVQGFAGEKYDHEPPPYVDMEAPTVTQPSFFVTRDKPFPVQSGTGMQIPTVPETSNQRPVVDKKTISTPSDSVIGATFGIDSEVTDTINAIDSKLNNLDIKGDIL